MRIKIRPSLILYLLCIAFLSSYADCIGMVSALLIHEAGHFAAARLTGKEIEQLELTPFGGIMHWKAGTVSSKGIKGVLIHAAGPLSNYAVLLMAGIPFAQHALRKEILRSLILANTSMLILNLLPALPLDGGQIVFCVGYYLFPIAKLAGLLSLGGVAVGVLGLTLALYGVLVRQMLNLSLMIVSLYIMVIAVQSRKNLLIENTYAIMQERLSNPQRIRRLECYYATPDTKLFEFIPLLKPDICVKISFSDGWRLRELSESVFCHALLSGPSATIHEAWDNFSQYIEKKHSES